MTTGLLKYKDGNKRTQIAPVFLILGTFMVGYYFLLLLGAVPTSKETVMRVPSYTSPAPLEGQVKSYRHTNLNLRPETVCTDEQRDKINQQLDLESGNVNVAGCNDPDWLDSFLTGWQLLALMSAKFLRSFFGDWYLQRFLSVVSV